MLPDCLVIRRGEATESSLKRFANWGIACAGVCLTAQISELPKTGKRVYLVGYLGERSPIEILAFGESGNEDSAERENKQS